jgi:hypothetical protein
MLSLESTAGQRDALRRGYRLYADWYLDAHPDENAAGLFEEQGKKLAIELYQQTAAIAPSESQIASDVTAQGWKIPRKFADGRLGRGWPAQWTGTAYLQMLKDKTIKKKRGRNARQFNIDQENAIRDAKPTLQQMQAFVIKMRTNARLFLASGWLAAVELLGGSVRASNGQVDPDRGGVEIRHTATSHEITIWNATPGVVEMDDQHGFVARAVRVRVADMMIYVQRKMSEAQQRYFKAA